MYVSYIIRLHGKSGSLSHLYKSLGTPWYRNTHESVYLNENLLISIIQEICEKTGASEWGC